MEPQTKTRIRDTRDYLVFKSLRGNRKIDKNQVGHLIRSIQENGNLTPYIPILVNSDMEVIDGQHRIAALKELGEPVYYRIEEGLNLDIVHVINTNGKVWGWLDFARSYADLGYDAYQVFLHFHDTAPSMPLDALLGYIYGVTSASASMRRNFYHGELEIQDYNLTKKLLEQYEELSQICKHRTGPFARALHTIMTNSQYNQARMVRKVGVYGKKNLEHYSRALDYIRALEDIYNWKAKGDQVRFF